LLAWHIGDELELLDIATDARERRRGLGRALLWALEGEARARGASAIYLEVRPSNGAARSLYVAHGFDEVGRRPRYYPDGEDALLMRRAVGAGGTP
jgi:ribosomal protein S18 acetylase RimI-like enzyme